MGAGDRFTDTETVQRERNNAAMTVAVERWAIIGWYVYATLSAPVRALIRSIPGSQGRTRLIVGTAGGVFTVTV